MTVVLGIALLLWRIESCLARETASLTDLRADAREERAQELLYLQEETVSIAARHEQPISQAPSNVYVITDEDIRQSGAPDLPTVLRRIPGLEVMQTTGAEFNVSVRGDNQPTANKLLVLVDGRSIYVDVQGSVFWKAIPVTLPEIKRIEVQKGPASVLYGFNAFDGIINIITKSPEEMPGATVQVSGGEYGTLQSAAVYAQRHEKFRYRLSYGHDETRQWRHREAAAFRDNKFNVHTEYALGGDAQLSVAGGLVDATHYDGHVTDVAVHTGVPALGYARAAYERPNFFVRGFWNRYEFSGPLTIHPLLAPFLQSTDRYRNPAVLLQGNTYDLEAQQGLEVGPTLRLTAGINYRHNTLSSNRIDRFRTEDRVGLYLQAEWTPVAAVHLVGGVRYDLDTFIHPTLNPRGSLVITPLPGHTLRATVAVGHRPPTLFETYGEGLSFITPPPPAPALPPVISMGSPNLGPEKIVSYEVEYQGWYWQHRVRVRAAAFFNHLSDLIWREVSSAQGGVADIYGGEAGVEYLATRWLSGFGNLAYQEIGQTFTETAQRGGPRFKWNAGLRGRWTNGLSGELAYHYVGGATYPLTRAFADFAAFGVPSPNTRVDAYHLLNLRGAYRFWRNDLAAGDRREAEVAVSVFNALNDTHKEHPLGDVLGSRVMGWLTLRY